MTFPTNMQALIDGDLVVWRCAAVSEEEDVEVALARTDKLIQEILFATKADSYRIFLKGSDSNWRKKFFPPYKENRKDQPIPKWLESCRTYLVENWKAELVNEYETDDALGINQDKNKTVICSIDKDLLQIPGNHYNFVKGIWSFINEFDGMRNFYIQLLMGDRSDNIPGISGVGIKKAEKFLEGCETEEDFLNSARALYKDDALLDTYAKCLWIWRTEGDIWDRLLIGENHSEPKEDHQSGSTMPQQEERNKYMEPIIQETSGYQQAGQSTDFTEMMENPPL